MHFDFEDCVSFGLHMTKICWKKAPSNSSEREEPSDYDAGLTLVKGDRTWRAYTEMYLSEVLRQAEDK